jgi:hypothetical protein
VSAFASTLCICPTAVGATTFNVVINSSGFSGSSATLAFDFLDGGPPSNTVTLSALTSNGTQGLTQLTGGVSGSGPWTFTDAAFFSELLISFDPLGTTMSFSFTTSDNPASPGSFPDAFSFFVLDSSATLPLITTDAPGGSDALFEFDFSGQGIGGLSVYTPDQTGYSIEVSSPGTAPEPGSLALLAGGIMALLVRRRVKQ